MEAELPFSDTGNRFRLEAGWWVAVQKKAVAFFSWVESWKFEVRPAP